MSDCTKGTKNIWSLITITQLVSAIASLGDRVDELGEETWRLNANFNIQSSLWTEVMTKLEIEHTERLRHSLYNIWRSDSYNIHALVEKETRIVKHNDIDRNDTEEEKKSTALKKKKVKLVPDRSVPIPDQPNTRANKAEQSDENGKQNSTIEKLTFVMSPVEWKTAFSNSQKKMNDGWRKIFSEIIRTHGIVCNLRFGKPYILKGTRKRVCKPFWCCAVCTSSECTRSYRITLENKPDVYTAALFLMKISGVEKHTSETEIMTQQLRGAERLRVGERANDIGPLAVFRERVEAADEKLLAVGNFGRVETIETIKKASADFRKKMKYDENAYAECRIIAISYLDADIIYKKVPGYVQAVGEMPFRIHLFSQLQIERYISYCTQQKYSFIHIDATGGILKKLQQQHDSYMYSIVFKDGTDANDVISLAHAILTDHTVPSIGYFFGHLVNNIIKVKRKLILPSFFVIDFSAALMNSILQAFNVESINTHLNRCWNVLSGKYNATELRSLSFIHLCCCHVIHAFARSLNAMRIDKTIRQGILHIFVFILCDNDINRLYETLGSVVNVFGDPNEKDAQQKFQQMHSLLFNVDEESAALLSDKRKILKEAKRRNEELIIVDEYFRTSAPIIHQSPFNREAIRLYPNLAALINKKSKYDKVTNPLFSPQIIRLFYRWWAYLPLWTGLLWNFEERYCSDTKRKLSAIYNPIRYSNALVESYFRTVKASIYGRKRNNTPGDAIRKLYRSVQAQFKANKFGVTQSSKGRKRQNKKSRDSMDVTDGTDVLMEKWKKKGEQRKGLYTCVIDKHAPKRTQLNTNDAQSSRFKRSISGSEDSTSMSSLYRSISLDSSTDYNFSKKCLEHDPKTSPIFMSSSNSIKNVQPSSNNQICKVKISLNSHAVEEDVEKKKKKKVRGEEEETEEEDEEEEGDDNDDEEEERDDDSDEEEVEDDDDDDEENNFDCYDQQNEISSVYDFDKKIVCPDPATTCPVEKEISTTKRLKIKALVKPSNEPDINIDGYIIRWPRFGINNVFFKDLYYKLTNTCATDSGLFVLYFIYKTDLDLADIFEDAPSTSPYSSLARVFRIVDTEGWDIARLTWLYINGILDKFARKENLFGSIDAQVFHFIKEEQRYSYETVCSRPQCKLKNRHSSSTELVIFTGDDYIRDFEEGTIDICDIVMARHDELTPADAQKQKYREAPMHVIDGQSGKSEYELVWKCNSTIHTSPATFTYNTPPIVICHVRHLSKRSEEGFADYTPRIRDLKRKLQINSVEYRLRGVIQHTSTPIEHFTVTLIGFDGQLYLYDDLKGVKSVTTSTGHVVYAIYTKIYTFDNC
ncbi:unnamed protein product [Adineta ricciae]|uniref:Uncharacterized protein n=1 Tax=Adineta ricciae TaxID=249248 RepID=A0A815TG43_ADIRI|nr:unnamed protein product [Adineta ricciae]